MQKIVTQMVERQVLFVCVNQLPEEQVERVSGLSQPQRCTYFPSISVSNVED